MPTPDTTSTTPCAEGKCPVLKREDRFSLTLYTPKAFILKAIAVWMVIGDFYLAFKHNVGDDLALGPFSFFSYWNTLLMVGFLVTSVYADSKVFKDAKIGINWTPKAPICIFGRCLTPETLKNLIIRDRIYPVWSVASFLVMTVYWFFLFDEERQEAFGKDAEFTFSTLTEHALPGALAVYEMFVVNHRCGKLDLGPTVLFVMLYGCVLTYIQSTGKAVYPSLTDGVSKGGAGALAIVVLLIIVGFFLLLVIVKRWWWDGKLCCRQTREQREAFGRPKRPRNAQIMPEPV